MTTNTLIGLQYRWAVLAGILLLTGCAGRHPEGPGRPPQGSAVRVRRMAAALALGGALLAGGAWWATSRGSDVPIHTAAAHAHLESAPLCPWREPERDLQRFFPGATGTQEQLRILSHLRLA